MYCGNAPKASKAHHKKEEYVFPFELQALRLLGESHISLTSFKTDLNENCRVKDVSHAYLNNRARKDESPRRQPLVPLFPATTSIPQQTPSFNTPSLSDSIFLKQPLNLIDCIQNLSKICIWRLLQMLSEHLQALLNQQGTTRLVLIWDMPI